MKAYFNAMVRRTSGKKPYRILGTVAILGIAVILGYPFIQDMTQGNERTPGVAQAAVISRPPNPHITKFTREFEKEINDLMRSSNTPGAAIAIVKDSTIVYLKGFGLKSSSTPGDSVNAHTAFRLASVSKSFASFLTGIVVEENKLSWQDAVIKYVPEFQLKSPEQTAALTITHVLSHTTGLPYHTYTNMIEEGIELNVMLGMLKDVNPSSSVGKEYSYQNVAYSVIGEVIKNATGKTYEQMMTEKVFGPLRMKDASMNYASLVGNQNIARPHRLAGRKWVPTKINNTYYNVGPAGGINASISDMAQWMVALLGHRQDVITKETLEHLYSPAIVARSKNRNYRKYQRPQHSYYGLGWRVIHYPKDTIVYHGGYVTGYRSEIGLNPTAGIAVCILANAPGELADNTVPMFFNLYEKYRDAIEQWESSNGVASPKTPI